MEIIEQFTADNGITFPMLRDTNGTYNQYFLPGGLSPYPRDFIVDEGGVIAYASTEYDGAQILNLIEGMLPLAVPVLEIIPVANGIQMNWQQVPGATSYLVQKSSRAWPDPDEWVTVGTPAGNSILLPEELAQQSRFYRVLASH